MVFFPNCKINLGLHVTTKRSDGYHDIETVFYPLKFYDAVEIVKNDASEAPDIQFSFSGLPINIGPENNLCSRAYYLLKAKYSQIPSIRLHLHKRIFPGGGLGGGSSDGATTLKLLNQKFSLDLSAEMLLDYALQLGSDCPFFIVNAPCFATGRGEFLDKIDLDLSSYKIILVNPGIPVSTAEAFSLIKPKSPSKSIKNIIQQKVETWRDDLRNDFEEPIFERYPKIRKCSEALYQSGAIYASMTGTGSTVYGIFRKENFVKPDLPSDFYVRELIN